MNYLAILVSAIVSMIIGSIWYGPLFGKMFMEATGMDKWSPEKQEAEKKKMPWLYLGQFVASLVMFFVLAVFVWTGSEQNISLGIKTAFIMWIGFVVPLAFGNAIWGGSFKMFWLNVGNMLFTLLAAGAIIGAWK